MLELTRKKLPYKLQVEYTQCEICQAPLGQESKDLGFPFCHSHRECNRCNGEMNQQDCRTALKVYMDILEDGEEPNPEHMLTELMHPACKLQDPTAKRMIPEVEYQLLNSIRLAITPNISWSEPANAGESIQHYNKYLELWKCQDHEAFIVHVSRLEAIAARARVILNSSVENKEQLYKDREKRLAKADKERQASLSTQRPPSESKEPKEPTKKMIREALYQDFMRDWQLEEGPVAKDIYGAYQKAVDAMKSLPENVARELAIQALIKSGKLQRRPGGE